MISYLRQYPAARRALSASSVVLALAAVGMLAYPLYSNLHEWWLQRRLGEQINSTELVDRYRGNSLRDGDALTNIKIPRLGLETTVVQGISSSALRAGAGHYPSTSLPCEGGNVAIAGHRTTYGKPFADVDRLAEGDEIVLETPVGSCIYKVNRAPFVTGPRDWSVLGNIATQPGTLTLTTCHPKGSARERLIVQAVLTSPPVNRV